MFHPMSKSGLVLNKVSQCAHKFVPSMIAIWFPHFHLINNLQVWSRKMWLEEVCLSFSVEDLWWNKRVRTKAIDTLLFTCFTKSLSFILWKDISVFITYLSNLLFLSYGTFFLKHIIKHTQDTNPPTFSGDW